MSWVSILLALVTVIGLSVGQILFKIAAVAMTGSAPLWLLALRNGYLWSALLVYGAATVLWIALLRQAPLRLAYPFIGLAFLIVPILAHNFLNEPLRWQSIVGAGFILFGIWISVAQN